MDFKLPAKVKRFKINCIFLKCLVVKYEKEIPWQKEVKDSESLTLFCLNKMYSELINDLNLDTPNEKSKYYSNRINIDIERYLTYNQELDQSEKQKINQILINSGKESANKYLNNRINSLKKDSFNVWINLMNTHFIEYKVFSYILLRSIFSNYDCNSRRVAPLPDIDTINWMIINIKDGKLSPFINYSRLYFLKLANKNNLIKNNGWKKISSSTKPQLLSAACFGSGWCIANYEYAKSYLSRSDFYILFSNSKPVVALRTQKESNTIIECQGRSNSIPTLWKTDIIIFIETMNLELNHRYNEIYNEESYKNKSFPIEWWVERINYWPLSYTKAPEIIRNSIEHNKVEYILKTFDIIDYKDLMKILNFNFDYNDYIETIKINPIFFSKLDSEQIKKYPIFEEIAIDSWLKKIENKELSFDNFELIPASFKNNIKLKKVIEEYLAPILKKKVTARPKTYQERKNRFKIDSIIDLKNAENLPTFILGALNSILSNENSNFSDSIFSQEIRNHKNFEEIRLKAWVDAVLENPTFYFAIPNDIKIKFNFTDLCKNAKPEMINKYASKISAKPWLLTQKNGVPKSIRYHEMILNTYIDSWSKIIIKNPYQLWVKTSKLYHTRVYISYAALCHRKIINSFIVGIKPENWFSASERTKKISVYQFATLLSVHINQDFYKKIIYQRITSIIANEEKTPDYFGIKVIEILNGNIDEVYNNYVKTDETGINLSRRKYIYKNS